MRTAEIRSRFLKYFENNGHEIRESIPLISPDPSILFTIAGMVPFIPYIVGTEPAPWSRAASVQKCIRTNDIDEVGRTTRHGTFFQMGGNFSFGDYFKEGACKYAWELLTTDLDHGGYGLEGDRLWVTIWEEDDEAFDIWARGIGLDSSHIQKLPREEIFWDTGQPGPAGPCAEIHYDRGNQWGPEGGPATDTQGDRYLEIWNLVFDQYLRGEGNGKNYPLLGELDQKAIDTGMGLERVAFLLQDKNNFYETDEVEPVIETAEQLSGLNYTRSRSSSAPNDVRMRVVADHVRSSLMLIGDGVRPGNEGAGYVLRRLLRRSIRAMKLLGVDEPVMDELMSASQNVMKASYPNLESDWQVIREVAVNEEEAFRKTLSAGSTILDTAVKKAKANGEPLAGTDAFLLHDTYGFPIDLTLEIAGEQGVKVDEDAFRKLMNEQKHRARQDALEKKTGHVDSRIYHEILGKLGGEVRFLGYTESESESRIAAILVDGIPQSVVIAPATVEVVLDQTPFWAEQGGQLADKGTIVSSSGAHLQVQDVQRPLKGMSVHRSQLIDGTISVGESVHAAIDTGRRLAIARAHTATHMVHKALHENLGEQATQAGSENSPSRMRFDFRHPSSIPDEVMGAIEYRVNDRLADDLTVTDSQMDIDQARSMGAMALFGEKYGKIVRVVNIGDGWSMELCAGTHVPSTGHIGRITVLGESSIGSGVRRIEALVGTGAYEHQAKEHAIVSQLATLAGAQPDELAERITKMMAKLKATEKEMQSLKSANLMASVASYVDAAKRLGNTKAVIATVNNATGDDLRKLAMEVRARLGETQPAAVALFTVSSGRPLVVVAANKAATNTGVKSGELVGLAARAMGGGGGGRDDLAQGGGKDPAGVEAAQEAIASRISEI
ncbi:MAG: alanine--tRNA ligase [Varibaculum sp.]|nr:alanine--tRNA ligase [Varibaculum sp.]